MPVYYLSGATNTATPLTAEDAERFKVVVANVSSVWKESLPIYMSEDGTEGIYDEMSNHLIDRMRQTTMSDRLQNAVSVEVGMPIVARFMYAGAAKAALNGYSLDQLKNGLYNHTSFANLEKITRERNPTARAIERTYGLKPALYSSVDDHLDDFDFDENTGLVLRDYALQRISAKNNVEHRLAADEFFEENPPIRCEGQQWGLVRHSYKAMLTICLSDPALFSATTKDKPFKAPIA